MASSRFGKRAIWETGSNIYRVSQKKCPLSLPFSMGLKGIFFGTPCIFRSKQLLWKFSIEFNRLWFYLYPACLACFGHQWKFRIESDSNVWRSCSLLLEMHFWPVNFYFETDHGLGFKHIWHFNVSRKYDLLTLELWWRFCSEYPFFAI